MSPVAPQPTQQDTEPDPGSEPSPNGRWRLAAAFALGAIATIGLYLLSRQVSNMPGRSVVWLLVLPAEVMLARRALRERETRVLRYAAIAAVVFAACVVVGAPFAQAMARDVRQPSLHPGTMVRAWLTGSVAFWLVLAPLLGWASRTTLMARARGHWLWRPGRRSFLVTWAIIVVCWLPYYVIFFPGVLTNDSVVQLRQAIGQTPLTNHHPVAHTLLIEAFTRPAAHLGSLTAGIALYTLAQLLFLSGVCAFALWYLGRRRVAVGLRAAVLAYVALVPFNPMFAVTMWKDIPFGGLTVLLFVLLAELVRAPDRTARSKRWLVAFMVVSVLFCAMRSNGPYAYAIGSVVLVIALRRQWRRLVPAVGACLVLAVGWQALVLGPIGARPAGAAETWSLPIQQITRVAVVHGRDLTAGQREQIDEFLPYSSLSKLYDPGLSDPVKWTFKEDAFRAHQGRFASLWVGLCRQYPGTCVQAAIANNYGYWYPDSSRFIAGYMGPDFARGKGLDIRARSHGAVQVGNAIGRNQGSMSEWPMASGLFSIGAAVWLLVLAAATLGLKRRWRHVGSYGYLAGIWLTVLVSPVFGEFRYLYGVILCAPFAAVLALGITPARPSPPEPEPEPALAKATADAT